MKTAVRLPIAIIFSETEILRQGGGMPKHILDPQPMDQAPISDGAGGSV